MLLAFSGDGRGMAAPSTLEKHTMWEAVPPGDSSARHGGQRKLIAMGGRDARRFALESGAHHQREGSRGQSIVTSLPASAER